MSRVSNVMNHEHLLEHPYVYQQGYRPGTVLTNISRCDAFVLPTILNVSP